MCLFKEMHTTNDPPTERERRVGRPSISFEGHFKFEAEVGVGVGVLSLELAVRT